MKRGVLFFFMFLLAAAFAYSIDCDFDPLCSPNITSCGCGGTKTRYTLCDGGCSDWYPCSVTDIETSCTDSKDNDCDSKADCLDSDCANFAKCIDQDNDGYALDADCDDTDISIHPGAAELCNGIDDNCDNSIDNSLFRACGTSLGICVQGIEQCIGGKWFNCNATPVQAEKCDTLDNDCDGETDEGCSCVDGAVRACGTDIGICRPGTQSCVKGAWSVCVGSVLPYSEICENSLDDDCDGYIDEYCVVSVPEAVIPAQQSEPQAGVPAPDFSVSGHDEKSASLPKAPDSGLSRSCIDGDGDGYGTYCSKGPDCDDMNASMSPAASELCNNVDDDCDGMPDEALSRGCGKSNIGVCTLGTEACRGGVWVGCSAVLPSEEVCGNGVDDDCDGSADDGCDKKLSEKELALKQFLDIRLGRDGYDLAYYLENYRKTRNYVDIGKTSVIESGRTRITLKITPIQGMTNLTVYEYVPKYITSSADNIIFSVKPEIIQSDPLFAWHFSELTEPVELSYSVPGEVAGADDKTSTLALAEGVKSLSYPWYFNLLPLLLIPLMGFVFIFLVEIARRKK
jgi:hypothetical protein